MSAPSPVGGAPEDSLDAVVDAIVAALSASAVASASPTPSSPPARSSANPLGRSSKAAAPGAQLPTASEELRDKSTAPLVAYSARPRAARSNDLFRLGAPPLPGRSS